MAGRVIPGGKKILFILKNTKFIFFLIFSGVKQLMASCKK
jgi:hypothetical protein